MKTRPSIQMLIARSSLGETAVIAIRARTPAAVAREIVRKAELRGGDTSGRRHINVGNAQSAVQDQKEEVPMSKRGNPGGPNRRNVTPSGDGTWAVHRPGTSRASSVHTTQADAIERARESLSRDGGGELTIHGRDGRIRDSDTISPGRDPSPPKDTK